MLGQGVRRRTHCALRAPLKQLRQVSARSACVLRHTHAPPALRFSARAEGNPGSGHPHGPLLRCAALGPACAARGACAREMGPSEAKARAAARLFGSPPLLAAPAAGRLRGEHGRRSAHASCSDSPWLSERRCAAAKRVPRRTPHPPRRRFAPTHRVGGADWGAPFLWGVSFCGPKKKFSHAGRLPASALNPSTPLKPARPGLDSSVRTDVGGAKARRLRAAWRLSQ